MELGLGVVTGGLYRGAEGLNDPALTHHRAQLLILTTAGLLIALLWPFDGQISRAVYDWQAHRPRVGGDVRRELEFVQQFGAITSVLIVLAVVGLMDAAKRNLLWRGAGVWAISGAAVNLAKLVVGRPRPILQDPGLILGPTGMYPIRHDDGTVHLQHAWQVWMDNSSQLGSMPSTHASAAATLAVILYAWYPRLLPLLVVLTGTVCVARVVLGAHYPSDVVAGAALGAVIARTGAAWVRGGGVDRDGGGS